MKIRGIVPSILGHSVAFPDGTSSAPSIAFSTDSGMPGAAAGDFRFDDPLSYSRRTRLLGKEDDPDTQIA